MKNKSQIYNYDPLKKFRQHPIFVVRMIIYWNDKFKWVWLFNGISNFMGYLMPTPSY